MAGSERNALDQVASLAWPLLGGIALVLALRRAAGTGLWFDESYTARLAELSLSRAIRGALLDVHPPVWTVIEWSFTRLPLPAELALRLPSALAYAALVSFAARRNPVAGIALLFHLPLLDLAAQARAYALLALGVALLPSIVQSRRWPLVGLAAGFVASLHGTGPAVAAAGLAGCVPWRELRSRDVASMVAAAVVPQVWWLVPWVQRAFVYMDRPWYALSTAAEWTTPTDGWWGLLLFAFALVVARDVDRSRAGAALGILLLFAVAELNGLSMDLRKLGVAVTGLLVTAIDTGPRRYLAMGIVAVGFAISNRHVDDRPDLRDAAAAVANLPAMPIVGDFASELRYYIRRPGPLWAKGTPIDTAARVAEVLEAHQVDCVAGVHVWDQAPDDELPIGVGVIAWAPVTGLDVRLYGTDDCRLEPVPEGWRLGHPCEDPAMRPWLCDGGSWQ